MFLSPLVYPELALERVSVFFWHTQFWLRSVFPSSLAFPALALERVSVSFGIPGFGFGAGFRLLPFPRFPELVPLLDWEININNINININIKLWFGVRGLQPGFGLKSGVCNRVSV